MKKFTSVNDIEYRIMKRNSTDTKGSVDASKSHSSVLQVSADRPILELDQRWMELKFIGKKIPARSHHIAVLYKDWYSKSNVGCMCMEEVTQISEPSVTFIGLVSSANNLFGRLFKRRCPTIQGP